MNDLKTGRILLVDDDSIITRSLEALIRAETPWEPWSFNRPSDALSSLEDRTYHAVISDFLMPEMDGIAFLKQVRESQPIASRILLTGFYQCLPGQLIGFTHLGINLDAGIKTHSSILWPTRLKISITKAEMGHVVSRVFLGHILKLRDSVSCTCHFGVNLCGNVENSNSKGINTFAC